MIYFLMFFFGPYIFLHHSTIAMEYISGILENIEINWKQKLKLQIRNYIVFTNTPAQGTHALRIINIEGSRTREVYLPFSLTASLTPHWIETVEIRAKSSQEWPSLFPVLLTCWWWQTLSNHPLLPQQQVRSTFNHHRYWIPTFCCFGWIKCVEKAWGSTCNTNMGQAW